MICLKKVLFQGAKLDQNTKFSLKEKFIFSLKDEVERDLIEEINARTKFPITKQDSYGHAIYHGAKKTKNVRKQGRETSNYQ